MLNLCKNLNPPYFILYVLVTPRTGREPGRYHSNIVENINEIALFLNEYKDYLETDGRHHIWIGAIDNSGILIYDQHNVIFSYGQMDIQLNTLQKIGFKEKIFSFPVPHAHHFNVNNDKFEKMILEHWVWSISPLTEHDTYDD